MQLIRHRSSAFTLIEILVVVAIIALLVAILLPSLANARKEGKKALCLANQRQVAAANYYYSQDFKGVLPHEDDWLYTGGWNSMTHVANRPVPQSGVLMGRRIPGQRFGRSYIAQAELFKCPLDDGSRAQGQSANEAPLKPANFSFSRNCYVMEAMADRGLFSGGDYFPIDRPKVPSRTPLMIEEMTVGPLAYSPLNDPQFRISPYDKLTDRHQDKAVLSYHDLHVETVNSKQYNSTPTVGASAGFQHYVMAPGILWRTGP